MTSSDTFPGAHDMADAQTALAKLPVLGPIAWLYARAPDKRFLFLADLDWAVLPPVILQQYRLVMKENMPFALVSWAFVSDEVHQRLLQGDTKLAPHEWRQGSHLWLIDVVAPFGGRDALLGDFTREFEGDCYHLLEVDAATRRTSVKRVIGPGTAVPGEATASGGPMRH